MLRLIILMAIGTAFTGCGRSLDGQEPSVGESGTITSQESQAFG